MPTPYRNRSGELISINRNPDRHKDGSRIISVRVDAETYERLQVLIGNNRRPHDTVGGFVRWLIETQALRKR